MPTIDGKPLSRNGRITITAIANNGITKPKRQTVIPIPKKEMY